MLVVVAHAIAVVNRGSPQPIILPAAPVIRGPTPTGITVLQELQVPLNPLVGREGL